MTTSQLQYNINAKRSKELCKEMERLVNRVDYAYKMRHFERFDLSVKRLHEIRRELDTIWDEQMELFGTKNDNDEKKPTTLRSALRKVYFHSFLHKKQFALQWQE